MDMLYNDNAFNMIIISTCIGGLNDDFLDLKSIIKLLFKIGMRS